MALHGNGEELLVSPDVERCVKGDLSLLIVCGINPALGIPICKVQSASQGPTRILI